MSEKKDPGTELAVALHYDGEGAPRVVASGRAELAERIVALAREHDVPLEENHEVAAVLAELELGSEIPEALYHAVAEILAFAFALSGRHPDDVERDEPGGEPGSVLSPGSGEG